MEIFAHVGPLKRGQRKKIQGDVLKLATLAKTHPASRLILAFADQETDRRRQGMARLRDVLVGDRAPCRSALRGGPGRIERCSGTAADGQPEPPGRDRARVTPAYGPRTGCPRAATGCLLSSRQGCSRSTRPGCQRRPWPRSGLGARNSHPPVRVLSPPHAQAGAGMTAQPPSPRIRKLQREVLAFPGEDLFPL